MARTYYAIYCRGRIVQHKDTQGRKMPLVFLSKLQASQEAERRTAELKKPNHVKNVAVHA